MRNFLYILIFSFIVIFIYFSIIFTEKLSFLVGDFNKDEQRHDLISIKEPDTKQEELRIFSPKSGDKIKSPLRIEGEAHSSWFFEGEFNAVLLDNHGNSLGVAILTAQDDWMSGGFVPFRGELSFKNPLNGLSGTIRFLSSDAAGLLEYRKVFEIPVYFDQTSYREIKLFYYNPERDKDTNGNVKCSKDGLVAVERNIPVTKTPIRDTINLLLSGDLTLQERIQGVTTEYPLEGFSLKGILLKDGLLKLEFDDPKSKTIGGSCRVAILWFQIEATAKQFPEVQRVIFFPDEIFQP